MSTTRPQKRPIAVSPQPPRTNELPPCASASYPALETETRPAIETAAAAHYLLRRPQTLRIWACKDNGPLRPVRIHGRLAWRVEDIRALIASA